MRVPTPTTENTLADDADFWSSTGSIHASSSDALLFRLPVSCRPTFVT